MLKMKLIGVSVLTVMGIILIAQNTASVETRFLFITVTMPRAVLLLVTMMIGVCIGLFSALTLSRRAKVNKK